MSTPRTLRLEQGADELLVLLPGAYMKPEGFVAAGFFSAVQRRQLALDVTVVDIDLATISGGQALPAIRAGVIAPARPRYRRITLGGISLGGFLSLALAADHPGEIDGLCLLARSHQGLKDLPELVETTARLGMGDGNQAPLDQTLLGLI